MIKKFVVILLFTQSLYFSQINHPLENGFETGTRFSILKEDAMFSLNTSLKLLESPYYFDNTDLTMAGIIITMTGASFSLDNQLRSDVLSTKSRKLDKITYWGEKFGRPVYATILSGLLYSSGLIFKDKHMRETGQILAEAMVCTGIYTQLLKISLGRARPYTGEGNLEIEPLEFEFDSNENSLPSGHTSIAFTVATVLSERIDNMYASIALYSLASLTAYQRIYDDVHWFSDTILGAALGTVIGLKIVKLHEKNNSEKSDYSLNVFPKITPRNYEVAFSLQF
ncbi:MAG: phosphatase PAP2 family protein [Melioribacteraceae bacterium]|nr:phosphatase PAP2 family protein [Melioribacteraceae bacterium]